MITWEKTISDWLQQCADPTDISYTAAGNNASHPLQSPDGEHLDSSLLTPSHSTHYIRGRKRKRSMASGRNSVGSGITGLTRTTSFSLDDHTVLRPKSTNARSRSSSPARRTLLDLRRATPKVQVVQPDCSIYQPAIVSELRSRLITRITEPYIPAELRRYLHMVDADQFSTYAHLFESENADIPSDRNLDAQWAQIKEIYESAKLGHERPLDEAHWVRLADRILSTESKTQANLLQLHDIRQQSLEHTLLPVYDGQPIVKKADLALGFNTKHALNGDIIEDVTSTRIEPLSQMTDSYTSTIPLVCGVEVKMNGGDHNEAVTQLAVWFAAGLANLTRLLELSVVETDTVRAVSGAPEAGPSTAGARCSRNSKLLPLVGWTIVGHEWRFYVSWKDQFDNVMMLGPWDALNASTLTHMKIWKLLTIVREVKAWLEEVYWEKLRGDVLEGLLR